MKLHSHLCKTCNRITIHVEDSVPDLESATVWHCLVCGTETRPNEPGTPNEPVKPKSSPSPTHDGMALPIKQHVKIAN